MGTDKKLREEGKYAIIKYDEIVTRDFWPRRYFVFSGDIVSVFRLIVITFLKMNTPKSEFEKIKFSSFDLQNIMLNNNNNLDGNFFNPNQFPDTNYFTMAENKLKISGSDGKSSLILDLNVKSFKKDLEKLVNF